MSDLAVPSVSAELQINSAGRLFGAAESGSAAPLSERAGTGTGTGQHVLVEGDSACRVDELLDEGVVARPARFSEGQPHP